MEKKIRDLHQFLSGDPKAKPSELTDFQLCVRAGVPLRFDVEPDGKLKVTTEKKCKVVRDENGNFLHVYVLEQT